MYYRNGREAVAGDKVFDVATRKVGVIYDLTPGATSGNAKLVAEEPYQYVSIGECVHLDDVIVMFPDRSKAVDEQAPPQPSAPCFAQSSEIERLAAVLERLVVENAGLRNKLDVLHKEYWDNVDKKNRIGPPSPPKPPTPREQG